MNMFSLLCLVVLISATSHANTEPECSRFDFAEKTLEKLVRIEHAAELREQAQREWETRLQTTLTAIEHERNTVAERVKTLDDTVAGIETDMAKKAAGWEASVLEKEAEWDLRRQQQEWAWNMTFDQKLNEYELNVQTFLDNFIVPKIPNVVFKAKGVKSENVVEGHALVFTDTIINSGDGYDVTTGYFTAPVSGSYMFTSQLCSNSAQWAVVQLIANGNVLETTAHRGSDIYATCTSLTGVTVLTKGHTVHVQGLYSFSAFKENGHRWNTFSGILVNAT